MARPRKQPGTAELDRILDRLDEALLAGDQTQIPPLTEQLWAGRDRAADVVTARLLMGRARVPAFAFELLGGLAGPDSTDYLEQVADAPEAEDLVRFGAQRRLGWPDQGEKKERLNFLRTLRDPDATLVAATEEATITWPPNSESLQEVLGYLNALPARRRQGIALQVAELGEAPRPWLLHALVHAADKTTQRIAMRSLATDDAPGADGPLGRLARTAADPKLRAEAEAARAAAGAQHAEPQPLPPVDRAYLSLIDGDGGQVALVTRRLGEGIVLLVNIFQQDQVGVKGVFGSSWLPDESAEGMAEELEDAGIAMVEVPLAAVRGAMAEALAINASAGRPVPTVYELWEPFLHETYPPTPDEPVAATALDDAPYAGRQDLLARSGDLSAHPFFQYWGFDLEETSDAMELAPPPDEGQLTDRQFRLLIAALAPPDVRERFRRRFRRQAWLLEQIDDTATRDVALAASAALATDDEAALVAHPFLREMVAASVYQVMLSWGEI